MVGAEVVSLGREGGSLLVKFLPGFIARRVFTEKRMRSEIRVSLRSEMPVSIAGNPAQLSVYLRIVNLSNVDIRVDRIVAEVWFAQPTATLLSVVPFDVPARTEKDDVYLSTVLSRDVAEQAYAVSRQIGSRMLLTLTVVCMSNVRDVILREQVERGIDAGMFRGTFGSVPQAEP